MDRSHEPRPIMFGEVLFDRFPDGNIVLGGAPFNVAWHLHAFGMSPLLVSRIGADALGRQISAAMIEWGMDRSGLQLDSRHQTGMVDISFTDGEPIFDIVPDRAFDFIDSYALPPIRTDTTLYHGSLALRNPVSKETLMELRHHNEGIFFVDVNLRAPWWSTDMLLEILEGANYIKLNQNELNQIVTQGTSVAAKAVRLLSDMSAELIVVTRGKEGAVVYTLDGASYEAKPEPARRVVDTVGAGDAFSAVLLLGQSKQWDIDLTLERAQSFASAIVGVRGATVRDAKFYAQFIELWDIVPRKLNQVHNEDSVIFGSAEVNPTD
jgi:fructokinase